VSESWNVLASGRVVIEAKSENLIGDRAYDSDPLDHVLRQYGIEMIAPHCSNRTKPPTQDRRRLRRFLRRWLVERFLDPVGSAGSSSVGNIIQRTSLASFNSLPHCLLQAILR
jgi:hypothetical protein